MKKSNYFVYKKIIRIFRLIFLDYWTFWNQRHQKIINTLLVWSSFLSNFLALSQNHKINLLHIALIIFPGENDSVAILIIKTVKDFLSVKTEDSI